MEVIVATGENDCRQRCQETAQKSFAKKQDGLVVSVDDNNEWHGSYIVCIAIFSLALASGGRRPQGHIEELLLL